MTKKLNIDIIAKDKSKQALNQVQGNLAKTKSSVLNLKNALIGIGAGAILKSIIDVGKEVENLQVRFKFLFGSAEEGALAFDNLSKFASKVPFSLEEITAASGNLAVVSKDANDLNRILEITGNVAAVTGLDFATAGSQIQRAFSGGIAAADIFREKGLRQLLGFKEGAKVSIDETIKAFEEAFSGDGRFANATDDLAQTLTGTVSMLQDELFNFKKLISEQFIATLTDELGNLDDFLKENEQNIDGLAVALGEGLAEGAMLAAKAIGEIDDAVVAFLESKRDVEEFLELFDTDLFRLLTGISGVKKFGDAVDDMSKKNSNATDTIIDSNFKIKNSFSGTYTGGSGIFGTMAKFEEITLDNTFAIKSMSAEFDKSTPSVNKFNSRLMETLGKARDLKAQFDDLAVNTFNNFSDTLADALMTGKFAFKDFARSVLRDIARIIARQYTLLAIQRTLSFLGIGFPKMVGVGLPSFGGFRANGGNVQAGQAYMVGEKGAEMFVPQQSGTIIPNEKVNTGTTNINFTINTVDATGVDELLTNRRSTIINVINDALNRQGKEALV